MTVKSQEQIARAKRIDVYRQVKEAQGMLAAAEAKLTALMNEAYREGYEARAESLEAKVNVLQESVTIPLAKWLPYFETMC